MVRHPQRIMSDLQDAIKEWEDFWIWANDDPPEHEQTVVEAARKYADLDYEAAAMERHRNGRPKCYEGPKKVGCYCWDTTKKAIDVALGEPEEDV